MISDIIRIGNVYRGEVVVEYIRFAQIAIKQKTIDISKKNKSTEMIDGNV